MKDSIRPIAIYLPQYHPIPENDEWWGKGFTEWRNVVNAKPRFEDHYQPHIPSDLGFYDLRLEEVREEQAKLAKENGIFGFCYYHYWFNGKRILDRPFQEVFESKKPDFPFCLCWANENWTRTWDGSENNILLEQNYSEEDDRNHIKHLIPYFKDKRYITVNEKPLFIFYKPDLFPNMKRTIDIFRKEARAEGLDLYICRFERWIGMQGEAVNEIGFDAAIEFQPLSVSLKKYLEYRKQQKRVSRFQHIKSKFNNHPRIQKLLFLSNNNDKEKKEDLVIDYHDFTNYDLKRKDYSYKCYPGVCPMWDNSSRRENQKAIIFKNSTPEYFKDWYTKKKKKFSKYSENENFIFINAWNEWAEGNHLEPCLKWGHDYLNAINE